jgi:hypothetical protein
MREIMTRRMTPLVFSLFALAAPLGAQQKQDTEAIKKDLTAVIALQGKPCGEVVSAAVLGEKDYEAVCKDGNKYRVYENEKGRVIVEKRK